MMWYAIFCGGAIALLGGWLALQCERDKSWQWMGCFFMAHFTGYLVLIFADLMQVLYGVNILAESGARASVFRTIILIGFSALLINWWLARKKKSIKHRVLS